MCWWTCQEVIKLMPVWAAFAILSRQCEIMPRTNKQTNKQTNKNKNTFKISIRNACHLTSWKCALSLQKISIFQFGDYEKLSNGKLGINLYWPNSRMCEDTCVINYNNFTGFIIQDQPILHMRISAVFASVDLLVLPLTAALTLVVNAKVILMRTNKFALDVTAFQTGLYHT